MKIYFKSNTCDIADQQFVEYEVIPERTRWCCKQLNEHDNNFQLWNVKLAKFHFKDISVDGNIAFFPMNFCPYCGKNIEYEEL